MSQFQNPQNSPSQMYPMNPPRGSYSPGTMFGPDGKPLPTPGELENRIFNLTSIVQKLTASAPAIQNSASTASAAPQPASPGLPPNVLAQPSGPMLPGGHQSGPAAQPTTQSTPPPANPALPHIPPPPGLFPPQGQASSQSQLNQYGGGSWDAPVSTPTAPGWGAAGEAEDPQVTDLKNRIAELEAGMQANSQFMSPLAQFDRMSGRGGIPPKSYNAQSALTPGGAFVGGTLQGDPRSRRDPERGYGQTKQILQQRIQDRAARKDQWRDEFRGRNKERIAGRGDRRNARQDERTRQEIDEMLTRHQAERDAVGIDPQFAEMTAAREHAEDVRTEEFIRQDEARQEAEARAEVERLNKEEMERLENESIEGEYPGELMPEDHWTRGFPGEVFEYPEYEGPSHSVSYPPVTLSQTPLDPLRRLVPTGQGETAYVSHMVPNAGGTAARGAPGTPWTPGRYDRHGRAIPAN